MADPYLSVVVPVFNEEDNVQTLAAEIIQSLERAGLDGELLFVNDGSRDATAARLDEICRSQPRVRALHLAANFGQSGALYAGLRAARGRAIATLDGDGQNDPADIPRLVERLRQGDVQMVCGRRARRQDSMIRLLSARIANAVRNRVTGDGISDTGCSLKVFTREVAEVMWPFNGMHRFMPALAVMNGFRITELPVAHRPRLHGVSKYGIGNRLWRGLRDLAGIAWLQKRVLRPVVARES